jgi:hypothetical protein
MPVIAPRSQLVAEAEPADPGVHRAAAAVPILTPTIANSPYRLIDASARDKMDQPCGFRPICHLEHRIGPTSTLLHCHPGLSYAPYGTTFC